MVVVSRPGRLVYFRNSDVFGVRRYYRNNIIQKQYNIIVYIRFDKQYIYVVLTFFL